MNLMGRRSKDTETKTTWLEIPLKSLESEPVPIVWGGFIDDYELVDRGCVPVLGLDLSHRPDILEMIRVHATQQSGDVETTWAGWSPESKTILLILAFMKPSILKVILEFDIAKQGQLVDLILRRRVLRLQPSMVDEVPFAFAQECVSLEVAATGFENKWDQLWRRELMRVRMSEGMRRRHAARHAERMIREWRHLC